MNLQEAKQALKEFGEVRYNGLQIVETVRRENNWDKYTGRYNVTLLPEDPDFYDFGPLAESVSMTRAFEVIREWRKEGKKSE